MYSRFVACVSNFLIDRATATVDCPPLRSHNSFETILLLDVAGKTRDFGKHDDDLTRWN